jgi:hypothetical protein
MNFRIVEHNDDIGSYWVIEYKKFYFWWQYEPGYWLAKWKAEKRLSQILKDEQNERTNQRTIITSGYTL